MSKRFEHIPVHRPIPNWRPSTQPVDSEALVDLLDHIPAVVIHFWAVWNGVDPPMDQNIQQIQGRFRRRILFTSCNVDANENRELCIQLGIASIPCLVVFVKHRPARMIIGLYEPMLLADEFERCLDPSYFFKKWWQFWKPSTSTSLERSSFLNLLKKIS